MHYIRVASSVVAKLGGIMNVRLLCSINNASAFQCGLVALGAGAAYISINNKTMKQLGLNEGVIASIKPQIK